MRTNPPPLKPVAARPANAHTRVIVGATDSSPWASAACVLFVASLLVCVWPAFWPGRFAALAQEQAPDQNQSHPGVYLNDSFEVRQEVRLLDRLEANNQWTQAALQVRNLADQHGDQLVRIGKDLYSSVSLYLDRRVSRWPPAGRRAYRNLYEEEARALLQAAGARRDRQALLEVLTRRFCTRAGGAAGLLLAQLRLEAGQFEAAASLLERLLAIHSDYADGPPEALALRVAALHWAGRTSQAQEAAQSARDQHPEATIEWLGRTRRLGEVIDEILEIPVEPFRGRAALDSWAGLGGNATRNRVVNSSATVGAAIWSFDFAAETNATDLDVEPIAAAQVATRGRFFDLLPAVHQDRVFLHDTSRAWALDLDTGRLLWRYESPDLAARDDSSGSDTGPPGLHAPAYHDGRAYLAFGSNEVPYYGYPAALSRSALLCLDGETGQPLWRVSGQQLSPPFATVQLDGAPICIEDHLLIVARRRKAFGFEDCLLMCFQARDGSVLWQTHLGGASAGGYGYRKPTVSAPAVSGDTVYVQSNLGTVAAVDLHSGLLRWLYVYPNTEAHTSMWSEQISPWQYNPTMVWKDCLLSAPLDLDQVLVLDRTTGRIRSEITNEQLGPLQTILGIWDDRLYFAGEALGAWDLSTNQLLWSKPLPDQGPFGRGLLVADALLVPTTNHLLRFSLSGELLEQTPWDSLEARGNVIATPNELLVASSHRLTCYARKDDAFVRLRRRMETAPHDPQPCLDLAEMAFRTGDHKLGLETLQQGIDRAGGIFEIDSPELKRRVFKDCISFADRLWRESPAHQAEVRALYELAAQCPPDTESAVLYRLKLAVFHEQAQRYTDAVSVYRQIITDRSLHELVPPRAWSKSATLEAVLPGRLPSGMPAQNAGELATRRIASLIQRHGRETYAPFEAKADELLEKSIALEQPALIQRVIDSFPNAEAAPRALVALGDLWMQRGQFSPAARCYKMAKNLYPERVDLPALYAQITSCYLQTGRMRTAAAWLRGAQRRFPHGLVQVDGRGISFAQWHQEVFPPGSFAEPVLPRLAPPLLRLSQRQFGAEVNILEPRFADEPGTPQDSYLAYYAGKLMLMDPLRDRTLWAEPATCRSEPTLLAFIRDQDPAPRGGPAGDSLPPASVLLLTTRHQVVALEPGTGARRWSFGQYPADLDQANADHENFTNFNNYALYENRLVCTQTRGQAAAVDLGSGQRLWDVDLAHPALDDPAALSDEFFFYHSMSAGRHIYPLLDAESGALLRVFEPPEAVGPPLRITLLPEGIALIITAQTFWAYDTGSGQLLWSDQHSGRNVEATIQIGLDGFYLSQNRRRMVKHSLYDSRTLWTSQPLRPDGGPHETLTASLHGEALYVMSEDVVMALDPNDGRILWEGVTGGEAHFLGHKLAADVVVAIDLQHAENRNYTAYFYDRRGGRIPASGGVLPLGEFDHLRGITLRDHCLLVVDGQTIHTWAEQ